MRNASIEVIKMFSRGIPLPPRLYENELGLDRDPSGTTFPEISLLLVLYFEDFTSLAAPSITPA
jgi:hypothetical protein